MATQRWRSIQSTFGVVAFAENFALFEGLADRDRILVLLEMLGRKVCVSIEADMVAVA